MMLEHYRRRIPALAAHVRCDGSLDKTSYQ